MANTVKPFAHFLDQGSGIEDTVRLVPRALNKVLENSWFLAFKTQVELLAVQVSQSDTYPLNNHTNIACSASSLISFPKSQQLFFQPSKFPYTQSDEYLTIQHVIDEKGSYYRLGVEDIFGTGVRVKHHTLNLFEVYINPKPFKSPSKKQQRLEFVNDWMETKKKELKLKSNAVPQEIHKKLTSIQGTEPTQKWYWLEWHELDKKLFPVDVDTRNFFSKDYKLIKFSKGIR